MKILVARIDHIGDLILTTPLIRSLARAGNSVDALVSASCEPILFENPYVVDICVLEEVAPQFPKNWVLLAKWIQSRGYDAIILPHAKPKELLFASLLSGVRRRVAMWAGMWGRLTFHQCLISGIKEGRRHFADILLDCSRAFDNKTDGLRPDFFFTKPEITAAREEMKARFPELMIIGIHPGCAGNTCNLPTNIYGDLALRLLKLENIAVVGTGNDSEMGLFEEWPMEVLNHPRFYNACGKWKLRELSARMKTFSLMVVGSTGPLHIADALELPTVSAFCSMPAISSTVWGNLTAGSVTLSPPVEYCLSRREHPHDHCDFGGHISVDDMYNAVIKRIRYH
jgi:ADP-heptose:LPS heptosyltransferase